MRKLGVALAMTIAAVGVARAADLPTKKERAASAAELLLEHLGVSWIRPPPIAR